MRISGLQKMTLLDFPGKVAATVFLAGCNFLCPFCHNSELLSCDAEELMTKEEFFAFLSKRQGILEGVCITGGEPTLQKDLPEFMKKIKDLGYKVKLDTNGYRPDILRYVLENGLADYVAMDIKNSEEKYARTAGVENFDINNIKQSIALLAQDIVPYEFRTTIVPELHSQKDIKNIAEMLKGIFGAKKAQKYCLQAFCDRDTVMYSGFTSPSKDALEALIPPLLQVCSSVLLRGV